MSTSARFTNNLGVFNQGTNNTDEIRNNQYLTPAYIAALNINAYCSFTLANIAALTGPMTVNLGVGNAANPPFVGDTIQFLFSADNTPILPPVVPTLVGSTAGGTLAAATYYYKITALNANGETIGSPEASVVTTGATSSVALSWAAVTGATSYKIYRGTAAGAENVYYISSTNSFTDTGVASTAGTLPVANTAVISAPVQSAPATSVSGGTLAAATYYYVITALTSAGESVKSNELNIITTGTTSSNTVNWAAVTGATGYRIYRGTAASGENVFYTVGAVTSYVDTGAANLTGVPPVVNTAALPAPVQSALATSISGGSFAAGTYYYVVTALNAAGETLKSNEQSIVTTGSTSSNTISWAAVTGATGYRVYRGTAAGGENVYYVLGSVTSFVDTGVISTSGTVPITNTSAQSRTVTWGTGVLATAPTIVIPAGKTANVIAVFNGASWCEESRSITI